MSEQFTIESLIKKGYRLVGDAWVKGVPGDNKVHGVPKEHKFHAKGKDVDGVHYDSQREYSFKIMLDVHKIKYRMKEVIILQEGFKYAEETIRAIKIIPDFGIIGRTGIVAIVDVKGMILPDFKMKIKMLKRLLFKMDKIVPIFMPTNKKEMSETIQELLKLI